jgi:hypothetical protein
VKVSQQASFTPLVRDVDPALFPGADQDTRPETVTAKANRIFVVGKRITQRGADGKNYSRALETFADHHYQVTCGSLVATGVFKTANIPLGMTYNDVPQVDDSNPGQWMIPTQLQDRTQTIVDPQTGALLKRVSLDAEAGNKSYGYAGAFLTALALPGTIQALGQPLGPGWGTLIFGLAFLLVVAVRASQGGGVGWQALYGGILVLIGGSEVVKPDVADLAWPLILVGIGLVLLVRGGRPG